MSKLNRAFSHKEIALILGLTLVLLGLVYYRLVYVPIQREILTYDTTELETQIQIEQARAAQIQKMKREIESGLEFYNGVIMSYDNQEGEINALYEILEHAESFHVTARQPVATGNAVRRNMDLTFTTEDYERTERIISEISNCDYRCLIGNVSIAPNRGKELTNNWVNCSMNVTFFETLVGANTKAGLLIQENNAA